MKHLLKSLLFFSTWKQNIETNYWDCYGVRSSAMFCKFFSLLLQEQMDKENKKTNIRKERRFTNSFRFINDLAALSDGSEFERISGTFIIQYWN